MKKFWNWLKWIFRGFMTPAFTKLERSQDRKPENIKVGVDFGYLPAWPVCVRCGLDVVSVDHECPTLPWSGDLAGDVNKIIGAKMQIQSICPHDRITRTPRVEFCEDCGQINPWPAKRIR